jgi:hypothetical protein
MPAVDLASLPPDVAAEVARLPGQTVEVADDRDRYVIVDVAREGRPLVGIVERRGAELWIVPVDQDAGRPAARLVGPLAHPRLAGPGYKVWILGAAEDDGSLRPRRLGVLRKP